MKKYRTKWRELIEPFEVVKETAAKISFIRIHKTHTGETIEKVETEMKVSNYCSWHNTFEEAKDFLITCADNEIKKQINKLEMLEEKKLKISQLTESEQ